MFAELGAIRRHNRLNDLARHPREATNPISAIIRKRSYRATSIHTLSFQDVKRAKHALKTRERVGSASMLAPKHISAT